MGSPVEIEVFRLPDSPDEMELPFPPEKVDEAIEGYDPKNFRVPLIVSHETGSYSDRGIVDSELAFGIVDSFRRAGNRVFAKVKKIAPEFKRWVDEGRLHSISSSFYLPESPNNPTPGKLAFRHIAALGVNPPAIKGMRPLELWEKDRFSSESTEGIVTFSIPVAEPYSLISRMFRSLRDELIDSKDLETAEAILPSEGILALEGMSGIRYVSSDMLSSQMQELWQFVTHLEERCNEVQAKCDELSRCVTGMDQTSQIKTLIYKEPSMAKKYHKAMAGIAEKDASMGNLADFMKALEMSKEDSALAKSYMDGTVEMPTDKKKKLAAHIGMSDKEFAMIYKPDEEIDMSERIALSKELAELREANERLQQELVEQRAERRKTEIVSFLEGEKRSGRITVGMLRPQVIDFGDKKETMSLVSFMCSLNDEQLAFMKTLISSLPAQVSFAEVTGTVEEASEAKSPLSFAEVGELARQKIRQARAMGNDLSEAQAVDAVLAEHGIRY